MKRIFVIVFLCVLLLACTSHPSAREIAKRVVERFERIRTLKATVVLSYDNTTLTEKIVLVPPNRSYIRYPDGTIVVCNGTKCWTNRNLIIGRENLTGRRIYDSILRLLNGTDVEFVGMEDVNGTPCYVLRVRNGTMNLTLWIDSKLMFPIKLSGYSNGYRGYMLFKDVEINVPVNESIFRPPSSLKMVSPKVVSPRRRSTITVFLSVGERRMNSSELSKYLGFCPVVPKGWVAVCGNAVKSGWIDLYCVRKGYRNYTIEERRGSLVLRAKSYIEVWEGRLGVRPRGEKYTVIGGVKVYEVGSSYLFEKNGIWYGLMNEHRREVVLDLIEHPVKINGTIPVMIERAYRFNESESLKSFVEREFGHEIYLPFVYDRNASLSCVVITNGSVWLNYIVTNSSRFYIIDVEETVAPVKGVEGCIHAKRGDLTIEIYAPYVPKGCLHEFAERFLG